MNLKQKLNSERNVYLNMPGAQMLSFRFLEYLAIHHVLLGAMLFIHPTNHAAYFVGTFLILIGILIFIILFFRKNFFKFKNEKYLQIKNRVSMFDILIIFGFLFFLTMLENQAEKIMWSIFGIVFTQKKWEISALTLMAISIYAFLLRSKKFD